ncbi:hypothetical protein [Burkholderia pseudomallei]|uniref:hypothetical protein n=1 Tax=Burkholderia pseudomallei TaxID=28450 RepID=UPI00139242F4|nr:hypothetical protein [Burkholderia pseudomallei]
MIEEMCHPEPPRASMRRPVITDRVFTKQDEPFIENSCIAPAFPANRIAKDIRVFRILRIIFFGMPVNPNQRTARSRTRQSCRAPRAERRDRARRLRRHRRQSRGKPASAGTGHRAQQGRRRLRDREAASASGIVIIVVTEHDRPRGP